MLVNIFLKYSNNKKKYLGVHLHNLKYQYLSKKITVVIKAGLDMAHWIRLQNNFIQK